MYNVSLTLVCASLLLEQVALDVLQHGEQPLLYLSFWNCHLCTCVSPHCNTLTLLHIFRTHFQADRNTLDETQTIINAFSFFYNSLLTLIVISIFLPFMLSGKALQQPPLPLLLSSSYSFWPWVPSGWTSSPGSSSLEGQSSPWCQHPAACSGIWSTGSSVPPSPALAGRQWPHMGWWQPGWSKRNLNYFGI